MITEKNLVNLLPTFILRIEIFGGLLYDRKTHMLYLLNKTGALILSLCKEKKTIREVYECFKMTCSDINETTLRDDFNTFLNEAMSKNFVGVYNGI